MFQVHRIISFKKSSSVHCFTTRPNIVKQSLNGETVTFTFSRSPPTNKAKQKHFYFITTNLFHDLATSHIFSAM